MTLENKVFRKEALDRPTGLPLASPGLLVSEPASTGSVRRHIHQNETISRVTAVGLPIAEDDAMAKKAVVLLEHLCRLPDGRTKALDVLKQVGQAMQLDLDEDVGGVDVGEGIEHIADEDSKVALQGQHNEGIMITRTRYLVLRHISDLGKPQRSAKRTNCLDQREERGRHQIVDLNRHCLRQELEMFAYQVILVLPDILGEYSGRRQTIGIARSKATDEDGLGMIAREVLMEPVPSIFYRSEQEGVQNFDRSILSGV